MLIPNVKRTWAFRGQTPHLYYLYRQDKISAINALSVSPKSRRIGLYVRLRRYNFTGLHILSFLQHLFRHLRGSVILLWDRGTIHRRKEVQRYLAQRSRIHVEWFPAYAPELNPAEFVWCQSDSALANGAPRDLDQLHGSLTGTMGRIRRSQNLLRSCIQASDLPWKR